MTRQTNISKAGKEKAEHGGMFASVYPPSVNFSITHTSWSILQLEYLMMHDSRSS